MKYNFSIEKFKIIDVFLVRYIEDSEFHENIMITKVHIHSIFEPKLRLTF